MGYCFFAQYPLLIGSKMKKIFIFIFSFFLFFLSCVKQDKQNLYVQKGLQAYSHQNLDKAIYYFSFTAKRGKEKATSLIMLGKSYYYKGNKKLAKKLFISSLDATSIPLML